MTVIDDFVAEALRDETPASIANARAHANEWSMTTLMDRYEVLYAKARERFLSTKYA